MTKHLSHDPQYHYVYCRDGSKIPCMCTRETNHHEDEYRPEKEK